MNGIIILDKPQDFTSFDAVAVARRICGERKIGHTGTLDPMATGVLPLLLGRAAKAADLLPDTDKAYRAAFRLGERRDTGDVTGAVVEESAAPVSRESLEQALAQFVGEISQVPPMYSAVSVNGKRLYQRLGTDPETREGTLQVACSKGTYIRTLIEDAARAAGSCGTMTALRRTAACGFEEGEALSLDRLRELGERGEIPTVLRPVESLFGDYPAAWVSQAQARRFQNGGSLSMERLRLPRIALPQGQLVRVFAPGQVFLGLGAVDLPRGEIVFRKLFWEPEEQV